MTRLSVLFVIAFVDMVGLAMIVPLLPFYATSLGVNATVVGILISAFSVSQLASAPFWGRFSDNHGRRRALLLGLMVTVAAYGLFAVANTLTILLACRIVQGLGGGTIGVVQAYVIDESASQNRTKALGWLTVATSLGAVVGPAFGSAMVAIGGRPAPGIGAALLALLVTGFGLRYLRDSERGRTTISAKTHPTVSELGAIAHIVTKWKEPAPRLVLTYAVAIGAFYGTVPIMPLLLSERFGITETTIGYTIMYLGGVGVLVRSAVLGPMIARFGEERLSRAGLVTLAAGLAVLGATNGYPSLLLSLTLMPLGTAFLFPAVTARLSRAVSRKQRGLYMSVQHTYGGISRVAFPVLTGLVMDQLGYGLPFYGAALLVLAALWLIPVEQEDVDPKPVSIRDSATEHSL